MPKPETSRMNLEKARAALKAQMEERKAKQPSDDVLDIEDDVQEVDVEKPKVKPKTKPKPKPKPKEEEEEEEEESEEEEEEEAELPPPKKLKKGEGRAAQSEIGRSKTPEKVKKSLHDASMFFNFAA